MEDIRREEVEWGGKLEQGRRLTKTGPVCHWFTWQINSPSLSFR